jgi:hypothetical protein
VDPERPLDVLEQAYLHARDARDRLDVARVRGVPTDTAELERAAEDARILALAALDEVDTLVARGRRPAPSIEDARAIARMRAGMDTALSDAGGLPIAEAIDPSACADGDAWAVVVEAGEAAMRTRLEACFAAAAADLSVEGRHLSRPLVLGELAREPDGDRRRRLFLALEPLWRAVDGDGGPSSPYRTLIGTSAGSWAAGRSPIERNAAALGVTAHDIEGWAVATLEAWRDTIAGPAGAAGAALIQPWDWWWAAGAAERALSPALPLSRIHDRTRAVYASLGADLDALTVGFDTTPRLDRPPVPVAFTTFGGRPHRTADGSWSPGAPWVVATYVEGGLGELVELVHEAGHAVHIAGIRTRPAFADWPDSDALTEALAELVTLDVTEPAWQRRWLGANTPEVPVADAIRGRYADVALDAAWALLEIRLHADPGRPANDVWTEITSRYLGIAPHPEWSWWALRGQLVQEPGYMANYAIGAVLATDLRAAIRAARGDWTDGDPGWYPWVRDHLYRFGLERTTRDVLVDMLGRAPDARALIAEIARAR